MITRIVKLTISPDKVVEFNTIFQENITSIQNFEGCLHVKGYQDLHTPNIFFTYSQWVSEEDLNAYRKSELFGTIWPRTKKLFCAPPVVNSLKTI